MFARRTTSNAKPTPRKRVKDDTPKGLFVNNTWHCDCDPRLPANNFTVKKDSPNKGRKFWSCQSDKDKGCGFFLWNEEAQRREASAVLNNTHTEVQAAPKAMERPLQKTGTGLFDNTSVRRKTVFDDEGSNTESEGRASPSRRIAPPTTKNMLKRKAAEAGLSEDDFDDSSMDVEVLGLLESHDKVPATPMRSDKTSIFGGIPTPGTGIPVKQDFSLASHSSLASEPMTPKHEYPQAAAVEHAIAHVSTPGVNEENTKRAIGSDTAAPLAPAPKRFQNIISSQDITGSTEAMHVLALLGSFAVPLDTVNKVCGIVSMLELKAKGYERGRDTVRIALQKKTEEITELNKKLAEKDAEVGRLKARQHPNQATALRR